jgi:hypothetical protein
MIIVKKRPVCIDEDGMNILDDVGDVSIFVALSRRGHGLKLNKSRLYILYRIYSSLILYNIMYVNNRKTIPRL